MIHRMSSQLLGGEGPSNWRSLSPDAKRQKVSQDAPALAQGAVALIPQLAALNRDQPGTATIAYIYRGAAEIGCSLSLS